MLAVAGGKGGAGKTTTTLGLATATADVTDEAVLAVDADVDMPNLHAVAGVPREPPAGDRADAGGDGADAVGDGADAAGGRTTAVRGRDAGAGGQRTAAGGQRTAASPLPESTAPPTSGGRPPGHPHPSAANVWVRPAPRRACDARTDGHDSTAVDRARDDLAASLDRLSAPHVLVDCPAGAGPDAVAPMRVADGVLVVSSLCGPALRDAAKTAAMARAVGTPVVGGVLTRTRRVPDGVESLLGTPVLATIPAAPAGTQPLLTDVVRAAYARLANRLADAQEL